MNEQTLTQLRSLRLDGMVHALQEQAISTAASALVFDDRFTLLVQREVAWRDERRVARLLKAAKLKVSSACIQDIDWRASRSLDRSLVTALARGDWIRHAQNLLITGATGCGKTWLGCALAHQAARMGFSVLYVRAARLFEELHVAHGDGSFARRLIALAKLDLLVIDDFAISPMGAPERNDLLELLDDRVGTRSTLITSQLPVKAWHTYLDDPTLAMPFWTELCTAAIALISRGRRCARTSESRQSIRPLWLLLCNAQGAQRWQRNSR
jgi:DNA replication protein DnaC